MIKREKKRMLGFWGGKKVKNRMAWPEREKDKFGNLHHFDLSLALLTFNKWKKS